MDVPLASELAPVAALVIGCILTALAFGPSWIHLAYRLPRMHAIIDTAIGIVSLLLAYLMYGRVQALHRQRDFGLAFALGFSGFVSLFAAISQGISSRPLGRFAVWTPTIGRLLVALLFAAAALMRDAEIPKPARTSLFALGIAAAFLALMLVVAAASNQLPWSNELSVSPRDAKPLFVGPGLLLAAQVVMLIAYLVAAIGFSRRRGIDGDLMTWLASASVLFALANVNYLRFPSIFSDWIYVGDLLRLGGVLLLFVGAAREISSYWTRAAAMEERRRLAHDLHDGVAQELSYIAAVARRLDSRGGGEDVRRMLDAAEHALDESRLVISTLAGRGEPLDQLELTIRDSAHRHNIEVCFEVAGSKQIPAQFVDPLSRIVREAINNAGRHGRASRVDVTLRADDSIELRVRDNGTGFDASIPRGGFGLVSMRERAAAAGGSFSVESSPGDGTTIIVRLPWASAS
jgi:signal transduction histidine kinase